MPTIAFRVDASLAIGAGHLMRCLTLANSLRTRGAECHFFAVTCPDDLVALVRGQGHGFVAFDAGDWQADSLAMRTALRSLEVACLVVDHYGLDARWEQALDGCQRCVLVIDDLANRPHVCDLLLDQAYGETGERYRELLPTDAHGLYGVGYALLRPEFALARAISKPPGVPPRTVHVFFGSNDPQGFTLRFSRLLLTAFPQLQLRVAVGSQFARAAELHALALEFGARFDCRAGVTDMAQHMLGCDVALGAPGMATWERACLGLPAAYLAVAASQVPILQRLHATGFCRYLGAAKAIEDDRFIGSVAAFLADESALRAMRALSSDMVDGLGAERVAEVVLRRAA
jgi:UDP-2,4-diacetamido-2,4,6-trideoxy-beta-L-altropyranose hydrolase